MAFRRRRIFKKRVQRKRRPMNISRPLMYAKNPFRLTKLRSATLSVKRTVYAGQLAPTANLTTGTTYFWQYVQSSLDRAMAQFDGTGTALGSLTNLSEYQALFDQYRLGAIKYTFRPRAVNYATGQTDTIPAIPSSLYPPNWLVVKDSRSTLTPSGTYSAATMNLLLEQGGKIHRADKPFSIYIKPEVVEQYGNGAVRYVKPKFTDLNTSAGTDMKHRGFHLMLFRNGFANNSLDLAWDVFITYYLTFKNPK